MADMTFARAVLAEDEKVDGCDRCAVITVELSDGRLVDLLATTDRSRKRDEQRARARAAAGI